MKKKQKYNFKGRPDRACSTDEFRPAMNHILVDEGNMIATNGNILVKIPLSESDLLGDLSLLEGYFIHRSQYVELLRYDSLQVTGKGEITAIKGSKFATFRTVFRLNADMKFVDYKHVLGFEPESIPKIGVNAKLLAKLISCFEGIDLIGFKMEFQGTSRAIHFHSTGQDKSFGLLMPYMLSDYL